MKKQMLSDYPSEAIRQAVADLKWVEKTPGYIIRMDNWVSYQGDTCAVCQAGAIAIRRGNGFTPDDLQDIGADIDCYETEEENQLATEQIKSFDDLRQGYFFDFLWEWVDDFREVRRLTDILSDEFRNGWTRYLRGPEAYKSNMLRVADILEDEGY